MTTRREFNIAAFGAGASLLLTACGPSGPSASLTTTPATGSRSAPAPTTALDPPPSWNGSEVIAMVMYPEMTALDLIGPQYFFASLQGATVHHVAATMDPVISDTGVAIVPTMTFAQCPPEVDLVFVPGGTFGTLAAMQDESILEFLVARARPEALITSVCTGSLVLAAAGLLDGYRATSHWGVRDLLALAGSEPVDERFVRDRNRFTGAGVSAGLDFGLQLVRELRGDEYARGVQLFAEYDPEPPLDSGSPASAPPETLELVEDMLTEVRAAMTAALDN